MQSPLLCLAFVIAGAGCAHHAEPAVQVRLASAGEFPSQLASPVGASNVTEPLPIFAWEDCRIEGENDQQLYSAAIEYVREQFDASYRRSGEKPPRVEVRFEGDDRPLEKGTCALIHVDPKNKVGRLVMQTWYGFDTYCVHVLTERGQTVLALKLLWSGVY